MHAALLPLRPWGKNTAALNRSRTSRACCSRCSSPSAKDLPIFSTLGGPGVPSARGAHARMPSQPVKARDTRSLATSSNHSVPGAVQCVCDCVIVGAGPAGLAAGLALAHTQPEWKRIVLLERSQGVDAEEVDKSYVYMIDGKGKRLTDAVGVSKAVAEAGVQTTVIDFCKVLPNGEAQNSTINIKDGDRSNVWLPRRAFLRALASGLPNVTDPERITVLHSTEVISITLAGIQTSGAAGAAGAAAAAAEASSSYDHTILVRARSSVTGEEQVFAPRLLLGCDGMNSAVRAALQEWSSASAPEGQEAPSGAASSSGHSAAPNVAAPASAPEAAQRFSPVVLDSPSAGLRFKVLQLPPNAPFRLPPGTGSAPSPSPAKPATDSTAPTGAAGDASSAPASTGEFAGRLENGKFGMVQGVKAPAGRALRLGLLPLRDLSSPRLANIITKPDHAIWDCTTGPQLRDFLQESFPQLDIPSLMTPPQLARAAASSGGTFPRPQYLRHFTAVLPPPPAPTPSAPGQSPPASTSPAASASASASLSASSSASCGVALLGDAVHCFPPDLGQGVNSALADVMELSEALRVAKGDVGAALPAFEAAAAPEAQALAQLMTFSYPYQYNQDPFARALWTVNFMLRTALHKVLGEALGFHKHSFLLVQDSSLSYCEVLRRAHGTTRRMLVLAAAVALGVAVLVAKALLAGTAAAGVSGVPI